MNKQFAWAALGALGLLVGCGDGGTTSTSGGGGSTSAATGTGGGSTAASSTTGAGGGSTSSTAGAGGGPTGEVCSACVGTKDVFKAGSACAMKLADCNADADCDSWFKCVQNCQTSSYTAACFGACDQSAKVVETLYKPIYDCTCGACKADCSVACP